jgi:hypothetical protein
VAVTVLAGSKTRLIRRGISPGMSVEQVVAQARGWLTCRTSAGPADKPLVELQVWPTSFGPPWVEPQRRFSTASEMATALTAEMKPHGSEWTMTFGYTTMIPKRVYFDVMFSPDGRVTRVSEIRWGRLD